MATNTFHFDTKTGSMSAVSHVQASYDHECECGAKFSLTVDWPENLVVNSTINFNNVKCPSCQTAVILPRGEYYVENFRLLRK